MLHRLRVLARSAVPYAARVELARLRHAPGRALQRIGVARGRGEPDELGFTLARRVSPMHRGLGDDSDPFMRAKQRNVAAAAARIDNLLIAPHQLFSFCATVGRPSVLRGFRRGLELHDEHPASGVGGGVCKLSNLLYLLALLGGMKIVERHRHALVLFPDKRRTVPFGCGATVSYNYADFRFENPIDQTVLVRVEVAGDQLVGELCTARDPGWRAEIYETDHQFVHGAGGWIRQNRIRRRFVRADGSLLLDEEVARNRGRVLYEPRLALPASEVRLCCAP